MISPEGFRELRKSVPLSRRACAEYLGCSVSTVRAWDRGRNRVPWSAVRLLRLLRLGDLGALHDDWTGWALRGRMLVTPEGHALHVSDMAWWSLTCRQAEGYRQALDGWYNLSEVFRSLMQLAGESVGVAGAAAPAGGALDPSHCLEPAGGGAVSADPANALHRPPAEPAFLPSEPDPVDATASAASRADTGLVSIGNNVNKNGLGALAAGGVPPLAGCPRPASRPSLAPEFTP